MKYCCSTYILSAILACFVTTQAFAQDLSVTVTVVDDENSNPVSGAQVGIYTLTGTLVAEQPSNQSGIATFAALQSSVTDQSTLQGARIYNAYPNPFSAHTSVPFSIDRPRNIYAVVYSTLGKGVASIAIQAERGTHTLDINLAGVAAGSYFVRVLGDGTPMGSVSLFHTLGNAGAESPSISIRTNTAPLVQRGVAIKPSLAIGNYMLRIAMQGYEEFFSPIEIDGHLDVSARLIPVQVIEGVPEFGTDETRTLTVIATASNGLDVPRDLAFHPDRPNELWTVNRAFDGTVTFFNPGTSQQTAEVRKDIYANHFMEEVSAIAMGANNTFATIHETRNTYDNQAAPNDFMGPALWSADLSQYAQVNQEYGGLLGSHLDMLHETPLGMGIDHDHANVYWVFDGYEGNIVRYDFQDDHGPGYDDHSDGIVRRYVQAQVQRVPDVPSHIILDKETGWLYINDTGNRRITRLDINSGSSQNQLFGLEPLWEYSRMLGATYQVFVTGGLTQPCGIALNNGRLFVTDHATGEIIAYNMDGEELARISTGAQGIMGIEIGPDGKIWYVDGKANQLVRVDP